MAEDPTIAETGAYALSVPVTLEHFDGRRTETLAIISELAETPSQLEATYSDSGTVARVLVPSDLDGVEFLRRGTDRWRVLFQEARLPAYWRPGDRETHFMQLIPA